MPAFIAAEFIGAILAVLLARWLWGGTMEKQRAAQITSGEPV
jgi:hypothetical protein